LTRKLQEKFGVDNVIVIDLLYNPKIKWGEKLNVSEYVALEELMSQFVFTKIYYLTNNLPAKVEQPPIKIWEGDMKSFLNVIKVARRFRVEKIFTPCSIAK